jgi:ABC-2 type transport system permease protein
MGLANRLLEIPSVRNNVKLRTFIIGSWLGWQIESNWADPFLFAVYSFARPVASVMILVVMYSVITNSAMAEPMFAYIYLGNALYMLVGQVITGVSWAVIDDREQYRVAKQLYTAPMDGYFYLLGRGTARLLIGSISVFIVIFIGTLAFRMPLYLNTINWGLFLVSTVFGIVALASVGLILGGITMSMARHFWAVGELVAGALYLFTGAIFPLDVLPEVLRPIGFAFPATYWLELSRRALLGDNAARFPTLSAFSDMQLLAILVVMTVVLVFASTRYYTYALHLSKEKGLIDMESSY